MKPSSHGLTMRKGNCCGARTAPCAMDKWCSNPRTRGRKSYSSPQVAFCWSSVGKATPVPILQGPMEATLIRTTLLTRFTKNTFGFVGFFSVKSGCTWIWTSREIKGRRQLWAPGEASRKDRAGVWKAAGQNHLEPLWMCRTFLAHLRLQWRKHPWTSRSLSLGDPQRRKVKAVHWAVLWAPFMLQ